MFTTWILPSWPIRPKLISQDVLPCQLTFSVADGHPHITTDQLLVSKDPHYVIHGERLETRSMERLVKRI